LRFTVQKLVELEVLEELEVEVRDEPSYASELNREPQIVDLIRAMI